MLETHKRKLSKGKEVPRNVTVGVSKKVSICSVFFGTTGI